MKHSAEELRSHLSGGQVELSVCSTLLGVSIDDALRRDARALHDTAIDLLGELDRRYAYARRLVISAISNGSNWDKGIPKNLQDGVALFDLAHNAYVQNWLVEFLGIEVEVATLKDLKWWCELQFVAIDRYDEAVRSGVLWPRVKVGDVILDLVGEADQLLDCVLSKDAEQLDKGITRLSELPDLSNFRTKGTWSSLCKQLLHESRRYMLFVTDGNHSDVESRGTCEALTGLIAWCDERIIKPVEKRKSAPHPCPERYADDDQPEGETTPEPAEGDDGKPEGVPWQDAAKSMLDMMKRGEPFTSQPKLARRLSCSPATVHKAIRNTPSLEEWAKRPATSALRGPSIDAPDSPILNGTPDHRQSDPADITEASDVDAAMAYLIDQATPDERARIHEMDPAEKRTLAETAYRDSDKAEQIYRHRKKRKPKED